MLTPDDLTNQQELLAIYRRNLDHLLEQAAQYGGEEFAPVHVMHSIDEARENIQSIKEVLRGANVGVEDKPGDIAPPEPLDPPPVSSVSRHLPQPAPLVPVPKVQPVDSKAKLHWWVPLIMLAVGVLVVACVLGNMLTGPDSAVEDATTPLSGSVNQSAAGTSGDGNALSAPVFPTAQPTPLPVPALLVSNTPGRSTNAAVAVDGAGAVHIVWLDNTPRQGQGETVLYRSHQPDGTWSDVEDLTAYLDYPGSPYLVTNLMRDLCLVIDSVAGTFASCQTSDGWSSTETLAEGRTRNVFAPTLGAEGPPVWVAGLNDVQFDGTQLDDGLVGVARAQFAIDANGGYHVVWERAGNPYSIEYRFSDDAGATWQPQERLSIGDSQDATDWAQYPVLVADDRGAVHLSWAETGKQLYRRWTATQGWGDTSVVADSPAQGSPSMAVTAQRQAALVWQKECQIFYSQQESDGTWSEPRVLNEDASPSNCASDPRLAIDEAGTRHIVWLAPGNDGQSDVFYVEF